MLTEWQNSLYSASDSHLIRIFSWLNDRVLFRESLLQRENNENKTWIIISQKKEKNPVIIMWKVNHLKKKHMLSHAINHVGEFKAEEGLVDVYVWIIYFFKKGIFINGSNYEHV